ncbi:hypothetical protein QBC39DRAFT_381927 [Podospora conica]|nr:hypothetical protein QBC39DRAFT_381927 [Schizothecium conicum]
MDTTTTTIMPASGATTIKTTITTTTITTKTITTTFNPNRLVLVQSRILTSVPSPLPTSTFHEWYDTVHIPDILQTPGVLSAARYTLTPADQEQDHSDPTFPYLALYPGLSHAWLTSPTCEFLRVPLQHPMLPGPGHFVFDVADFVLGAYIVQGTTGGRVEGTPAGVVLEVVSEEEVQQRGMEGVLKAREGAWGGGGRTSLLEWDFNPAEVLGREEEVKAGRFAVGGRWLVLHELDAIPEHLDEKLHSGGGSKVFRLHKAFGEERPMV